MKMLERTRTPTAKGSMTAPREEVDQERGRVARSKYEIKAQKTLEAEGYQVDYKARPFRVPRGYSVDYLGRFDLLAYEPARGLVRCIAIKGHQGVPSRLRRLVEEFTPSKVVKEIWTYKANGSVKKEIIE